MLRETGLVDGFWFIGRLLDFCYWVGHSFGEGETGDCWWKDSFIKRLLAYINGRKRIDKLRTLVEEHQEFFKEYWHDYFN